MPDSLISRFVQIQENPPASRLLPEPRSADSNAVPDTDYTAADNIRFHKAFAYSAGGMASDRASSLPVRGFEDYIDTAPLSAADMASDTDLDWAVLGTALAALALPEADYIAALASVQLAELLAAAPIVV